MRYFAAVLLAFRYAPGDAFEKALRDSGVVLLEPSCGSK
jgi:hypothetical protein